MTIALLCAVPPESALLLEHTAVREKAVFGMKQAVAGRLAGRDIVLCAGGMGKANAAHAATLLVARFNPEALLIFGVGGAYPSSGAGVGDVALASEEIAADEGVLTPEGFKDAEFIGIPLLKTAGQEIFSTYRSSERLLHQARKTLLSHPGGAVMSGPFVTLSTCTGTAARSRELEDRYHGLCENMEGAAAVHVATCHDVPWLEVRGISNIVEDRNLRRWNIPKAAEAVQTAVMKILQEWSR